MVLTAASTTTVSSTISLVISSTREKTQEKLEVVRTRRITLEITSPSKVTPPVPSHLLEEQDSEEDDEGPFGYASSPSQLHVKCQEDDFEEKYGEYQYAPQQKQYRQGCQEEMVGMPSSLLMDLHFMLADYRKRIPPTRASQEVPLAAPRPRSILTTPVRSQELLPEPLTRSPQPMPQQDPVATDDDQEEGEITDLNKEWDDYLIHAPSSPSPVPIDSPPEDIGGFHNLIERAAKRFELPMSTVQTECFLYDFKEPYRKSVSHPYSKSCLGGRP